MKRWSRRILRRYGVYVPFSDVVCLRYKKTIRIGPDAGVDVTIERALTFLAVPEAGDLRDLLPIGPDDGRVHESPDALELLRTPGPGGTYVYWAPREAIVPYALYVHQYGWSSSGGLAEAALYSEFRCDTRTGQVEIDISAPCTFEAAVAFPRPGWGRMATEHRLVRDALHQLESGGERPAIVDDGSRLEWKISGPQVGGRYVCIAFQKGGIELWQRRLEAGTLAARLRRLIRPLQFGQ